MKRKSSALVRCSAGSVAEILDAKVQLFLEFCKFFQKKMQNIFLLQSKPAYMQRELIFFDKTISLWNAPPGPWNPLELLGTRDSAMERPSGAIFVE